MVDDPMEMLSNPRGFSDPCGQGISVDRKFIDLRPVFFKLRLIT